jgi:hypothetical protein
MVDGMADLWLHQLVLFLRDRVLSNVDLGSKEAFEIFERIRK